MRLRSLLFVPSDRPERFGKAAASGADALILDLEDSVTPGAKAAARNHCAQFLAERAGAVALWVRINPLDSGLAEADLAAVLPARPHGIMLPKSAGGETLRHLTRHLDEAGAADVRVLPIATETPAAVFSLGTYGGVTERLAGLTWGAEDLPAAIGAATSRELNGRFTAPYEMVRALALFGAHAAGVAAIETVYPDFRDTAGLAAYAATGARDGFTGMMAIHPRQIETINAAFTPTAAAIEQALRIVRAFETHPNAGALSLDGRMIDAPHLKQALGLLSRSESSVRARMK